MTQIFHKVSHLMLLITSFLAPILHHLAKTPFILD